MNFEESFRAWLGESVSEPIPASVRAFAFNLFEYPETPAVKFGIELIGAGSFDLADADWACDEVWEPSCRRLEIPASFSGRAWEDCLDRVKGLVLGCLESRFHGPLLKRGEAVGLGFVDGDLSVLWHR